MRNIYVLIFLVFGVGVAICWPENFDTDSWVAHQPSNLESWKTYAQETIRAPGKIEGRTEAVELRSRIREQITEVTVSKGQWVVQGDVLVALDSEQLVQQFNLAKAALELANANQERVENGPRESEIEAARSDYQANLSPLWSAKRAYDRGKKLFRANAISERQLDDLKAHVDSLTAKTAGAKQRLATLEMPPRQDEMSSAIARVHSAQAQFKIAEINLRRANVVAPFDGRVLEINAKQGELTSPDNPLPLVVMVDNRQLFAIAEVDEFDALRVKVGQACEITTDASFGQAAIGEVVEVAPQMWPKKIVGHWAGERNDTSTRRVKIALKESIDMPIGLPVEITIMLTFNQP